MIIKVIRVYLERFTILLEDNSEITFIVQISLRLGMLYNVCQPPVRRQADSIGKEAFLEPLIVTSPLSGIPPSITILSIFFTVTFHSIYRLEEIYLALISGQHANPFSSHYQSIFFSIIHKAFFVTKGLG